MNGEEERQVKLAIADPGNPNEGCRALDVQRVFELANKGYSLYFSEENAERAKLLRMMCSNFSVSATSVMPSYTYPFETIFKRAQMNEWSGREDSNLRPPGPEPGALPDCATPRTSGGKYQLM